MTVLAHAVCFPGRARSARSRSPGPWRPRLRRSRPAACSARSSAPRSGAAPIAPRRAGHALGAQDRDPLLRRHGTAREALRAATRASRSPAIPPAPHSRSRAGSSTSRRSSCAQFDPWAYWTISRAMDLFDFGAHGATPEGDAIVHAHADSDVARAAAFLKVERALVVGVEQDLLFPVEQQRTVASVLRAAGIDTELSSSAPLRSRRVPDRGAAVHTGPRRFPPRPRNRHVSSVASSSRLTFPMSHSRGSGSPPGQAWPPPCTS